jgi:hypothetical protein
MVRGIDADHVQQISRAHRPAKLFLHHFVDFAEIRPSRSSWLKPAK